MCPYLVLFIRSNFSFRAKSFAKLFLRLEFRLRLEATRDQVCSATENNGTCIACAALRREASSVASGTASRLAKSK